MDLSLIFLYHLLSTQNNNSAINQLSFNFFFLTLPRDFLAKKISRPWIVERRCAMAKEVRPCKAASNALGWTSEVEKKSILCSRLRPSTFHPGKSWRFWTQKLDVWMEDHVPFQWQGWFFGFQPLIFKGGVGEVWCCLFWDCFLLNKSGPGISFAKKGWKIEKSHSTKRDDYTPEDEHGT